MVIGISATNDDIHWKVITSYMLNIVNSLQKRFQ